MNYKTIVFILPAILALTVAIGMSGPRGQAQKSAAQVLLPVNVEGRFGYVNTVGRFVIEPQFETAEEFSEGLAVVGKKTGNDFRYGYIDEKGELAIPIKFQNAREFSEGFAVVRFRDQYGFIDTSGQFIAEPIFDKASDFSDGMARICQTAPKKVECLYGFIDREGKMVIEPQYVFALDFREGMAGFAVEDKKTIKMGFIDKRNRVVIKPKFSVVSSFSEGLAAVAQHGKTYWFEGQPFVDRESSPRTKVVYVDKRGSVVIAGDFESAESFSEGLARVEIDGRCSYIDKSGKVMVRPGFPAKASCGNFSEGMASVNAVNGAKFIDKNGKTVINTDFDWADDFHGGVAKVSMSKGNGLLSYGYIDRSGRIIWRPGRSE